MSAITLNVNTLGGCRLGKQLCPTIHDAARHRAGLHIAISISFTNQLQGPVPDSLTMHGTLACNNKQRVLCEWWLD